MADIAVTTLGCKVNHYESAGISEALARSGHRIVPFGTGADIYIINTCTVTAKTDYQSRQLVRRAHRTNPRAAIVVTGCYAQLAPLVFRSMPGVTLVAGTSLKEHIPSLIDAGAMKPGAVAVDSIDDVTAYSTLPLSSHPGQTRAYLKIQDGCDERCAYCVIPHARGRSRSRPVEGIIDEVRRFIRAGHREVVLTGIHLGHYGRDLAPPVPLASLIRRLEDETSLERIRLSSLEPQDVTDDLIALIRHSRRLCRHFHIPLQSGDDHILALMNRTYSTAGYASVIGRILEASPDAAIGIDIMTGFPGETAEHFARTVRFVDSLQLAYFHVFPYSRRPNTEAAEMPKQVPGPAKKDRARILRDLGEEKRKGFAGRFVGKELAVLIEGVQREGILTGFSDTYIPVLVIHNDISLMNRIVAVRGESLAGTAITGRVSL